VNNTNVAFVAIALIAAGLGALVFWVSTLIECLQVRDDATFQSGSKNSWTVVILLTGVIGAALYRAAGRPRGSFAAPERGGAMGAGDPVDGRTSAGHICRKRFLESEWTCSKPGCRFSSSWRSSARTHESEANAREMQQPRDPEVAVSQTTRVRAVTGSDFGFVPPERSASPLLPPAAVAAPPPTSAVKSCPDCAEEIRAAARKCRFCGYRFAPVVSSSDQAAS
jgi:Uncharacterised protein family UPF0547